MVTFDCFLVSFSFESVVCNATISAFWELFSGGVTTATVASRFGLSPIEVLSRTHFLMLFQVETWWQNVVLLIDKLSELYDALLDIRDECLQALREIRNNNGKYVIHSVIAVGTFGIVNLDPLKPAIISPFNVSDHVQNLYFTIEGVRKLFYEFVQDHKITIEDAVVEDILAKLNGCITLFNRSMRAQILS